MSDSKPRRVCADLTRLAPWCLLIATLPARVSQPPDTHPDGAPTHERCAAYQQVPVASDIAVPQVLHYWTGDRFRMTRDSCLPLPR